MTEFLLSLGGTASALVLMELAKQVGVRLFKSEAPKVVARGLELLDEMMPGLIEEGINSAQAEAALRKRLGSLTGDEWLDIRKRYDPAVLLEKTAY